MAVIPCKLDADFQARVQAFSDALLEKAHLVEGVLDETEFKQSGLLRAAVERLRGQFVASRWEKRDFLRRVLNHLQDLGSVADYREAESTARYDFAVDMHCGSKAAISATGCLDGNNTNLFERPAGVDEFVIWSLCTNPGADPRRNARSGLHTRLSAEIVARPEQVTGLVIWDWICGTVGRPCPKVTGDAAPRLTEIGPWRLTPPCIYLLPCRVPSTTDPEPASTELEVAPFLMALHDAFGGRADELNHVTIEIGSLGDALTRRTTVRRAGTIVTQSSFTPIKRL